ncbi:hypothetical protein EWM64_g1805 [Hericium alpestre]|uniref:Uncharacterized protein n=1 Tax=Hericium alpestre TaxID=135208 RepID=A0A4Z0A8F0_9AGAM|nr:hypothetical protein EWM64_g1805 [Hericium alpestre]
MISGANTTSPYSFYAIAPTAPHAFSLFGQSPRDMHDTYDEFGYILRPSNRQQVPIQKKRSFASGSLRGLRKLFGSA